MPHILVLNGPNLNLLGTREADIYGDTTLGAIEGRCQALADALGDTLDFFQHNHEGVLVDRIQQAGADQVDFLILNPAAFTHTSVAIRDAVKGVDIPSIEVHLSNLYRREKFRKNSYLSEIVMGTIAGLGAIAYELAVIAAHHHLTEHPD